MAASGVAGVAEVCERGTIIVEGFCIEADYEDTLRHRVVLQESADFAQSNSACVLDGKPVGARTD